ncbi:MAG: agmatinase family protein [Bacteroidia bacterium]
MDSRFDPNGPALLNGNLYGLPFTREEAKLVLIPVPWDTTVSYRSGTALAPLAILEASAQVELYHDAAPDAWQAGIWMAKPSASLIERNHQARAKALKVIQAIEQGESMEFHAEDLAMVNQACAEMVDWVKTQSRSVLAEGKIPAVLGGDHSTPLGLIQALAEVHPDFGILQIDAHLDLRMAYEGFTYSHASIMYNALALPQVSKLVSVAVRDYCQEEIDLATDDPRIEYFSYRGLVAERYHGSLWAEQLANIIAALPSKVYISFDIDGLDPSLCPDTGTPVPGGLQFAEACYLLEALVDSGREIIGFDLCEVAPAENDWNAIVGARTLFQLFVASVCSQKA